MCFDACVGGVQDQLREKAAAVEMAERKSQCFEEENSRLREENERLRDELRFLRTEVSARAGTRCSVLCVLTATPGLHHVHTVVWHYIARGHFFTVQQSAGVST